MPSLSESIVDNVGESYISTYLKGKGHTQPDEKKGQALKYWVDDLFKEQKIDIDDFESFLFDELFFGKRKTIRMYRLEKTKEYKFPIDWEMPLDEHYGLDSIDFCNILNTIPNEKDARKIAAIRSEENVREELVKIKLLFVFYIEINEDRNIKSTSAYIPVEINFQTKTMLIKAWTRQYVDYDPYKAGKLIQHVKDLLEIEFKVSTPNYGIAHKKILFNMSRNLIYEAYSKVPAYNKIENMKDPIRNFIKETYEKLSLWNTEEDDSGEQFLAKEVLDYEGELKNVLESLAISDHFFNRSYDEIWEMGLEAVISRIKFNDKEKVLASLKAEDTETPIFCTKTFMSLKTRMQETKRIESLWIAMDREKGQRGHLNVRFDASDQEYLGLLVTNYSIRFNESDMNIILRIYDKYEAKSNKKDTGKGKMAVG
ncbi:hypothetical protein D7V94_03595 [Parablautia intestinalis]|uniref:Uncharacterized protein n=1 Tax=Parablautia intestinalis TaxID=2320100 RepID=A0A3A9B1Z1_9FIRM|nr:hypothetical protein [Parablautia intestinalis]MCI8614392.1 hypothetical protein [Lachnospiraceae bacterium]RKI93761.1 hypothetical protein D7V94_03595 [Parablautia intestinalis]